VPSYPFDDGVSIQRGQSEGCLTLSGYDECLSSVSISEYFGSTRRSTQVSIRVGIHGRIRVSIRGSIRGTMRKFIVP
jgi:hypothetical protein